MISKNLIKHTMAHSNTYSQLVIGKFIMVMFNNIRHQLQHHFFKFLTSYSVIAYLSIVNFILRCQDLLP